MPHGKHSSGISAIAQWRLNVKADVVLGWRWAVIAVTLAELYLPIKSYDGIGSQDGIGFRRAKDAIERGPRDFITRNEDVGMGGDKEDEEMPDDELSDEGGERDVRMGSEGDGVSNYAPSDGEDGEEDGEGEGEMDFKQDDEEGGTLSRTALADDSDVYPGELEQLATALPTFHDDDDHD